MSILQWLRVMQPYPPTLFLMTGYSLQSLLDESGYFHIWLAQAARETFFQDALEKNFFLSQLKNLLMIGQGRPDPTLELLAYSLTKSGVHLLLHTQRRPLLECFVRTLMTRFNQYRAQTPLDALLITDRLSGTHQALGVSREIHLLHHNWRYTRYSSIGFYLDGRSSSWMQHTRLTHLFNHEPAHYLQLLQGSRTEADRIFAFIET